MTISLTFETPQGGRDVLFYREHLEAETDLKGKRCAIESDNDTLRW